MDHIHNSPRSPRFIGSEIYRGSSYGKWHPLRIPRVSTVMDLSRALGWLPREQYITSPRAKPQALTAWHTPEYIAALQAAENQQHVTAESRARFNLGTVSNPVFSEMFRRPATSAGGSILAGHLLAQSGVVFNPGGGTHHGMPGQANGFCYLNDPVLAMKSLRANGVQRIAYIDIDAHHPDGVAVGFSHDPDCLMISVHEENLWPKTGTLDDNAGGNAINLPVPRGFHDDDMALVRDSLLLPQVTAFRPEAIVLQCGADGVRDDPLSHLCLSNNAHWQILTALIGIAPRLLVLGGGGYNPWTVGRLWTGLWGILTGKDIPARLPPDAVQILRSLEFRRNSRGKNPPVSWLQTLQDPPSRGALSETVRARVRHLSQRHARWI
ncbi:acetoin utilization protein AcuC [Shimia sp. MMG029]|uniref:acetoin utilization protein AcuC n=1 Tax=Shimia sp. MMG029 TaxID=3021978 RepID=UPI0022FDEC5F|nr:acetoin utilization protein AcuC [Shimia sp. MMG029]MDA5557653.1 acetoin utilization protein AcuC [Shimia sp. MMG029]